MKSRKLRWFNTTPLGVPVEPEVFIIQNGSVSITDDHCCFTVSLLIFSSQFTSSIINIGIFPETSLINSTFFTSVIIKTGSIKSTILLNLWPGVFTSRFINIFALFIIAIFAITASIHLGRKTATGRLTDSAMLWIFWESISDFLSRSLKEIVRVPSTIAILSPFFVTERSKSSSKLITILLIL